MYIYIYKHLYLSVSISISASISKTEVAPRFPGSLWQAKETFWKFDLPEARGPLKFSRIGVLANLLPVIFSSRKDADTVKGYEGGK